MSGNRIFVADWRTEPEWLKHGYQGALKVVDSRKGDYLENADAPEPFPAVKQLFDHGWGVHQPGDDHRAVLSAAKAQIDRLGLTSYGMDLEDGWFYDGPWGDEFHDFEEHVYMQMEDFLVTAREVLGEDFPLWVCIYPFKDYPAGVFAAAHVEVVVMLYGAAAPLPNAGEAWVDALKRYWGCDKVSPALWAGQPNYGPQQGPSLPNCYRFDAEIMRPSDYK